MFRNILLFLFIAVSAHAAQHIWTGSGDPMNTVTGDPGDIYVDTDAGEFYVKKDGVADSTGWVPLAGGSYASTGNSTTSPLTGGATFTGTGEQNSSGGVACQVKTDAAGTLYYDFSIDGTNWDSTYPVSGYTIDANIAELHEAVKLGRYFRARLVNGTAAQTFLRMKCYYGDVYGLRASANQAPGRDADAEIVRLYADPQDEIVLGQRTGVFHYTKFGYLPDVDAADGALMITADPAKPTGPEILTTGETWSIAYNGTTDGSGSTGCTTVFVDYLNDDGEQTSGTHALDGTSPDTTSFSGLGINRAACAASGSADTNTNAITFTSSTTGGVHAYIPAGEGVTQQALYHTPSNGVGVAKLLFANVNKISGGASPVVTLKGWAHNRSVDTKFEVFRYIIDTGVNNSFDLTEPVGFKLTAGDVLYFTADTDTNNTVVGALRFSLNVYEDN